MSSFSERIQHAWNAFKNGESEVVKTYPYLGSLSSYRPGRFRFSRGAEKSIVTSVYNRIAVDSASATIQHVKLDKNGRYSETMKSGLNYCLTVSANIDQTGRAFIQDAIMSMLDEGIVAIVPTDTDDDPKVTESNHFDILTMRTGKIIEWYPSYVKLCVYNEKTGKKENIVMPKKMVAIVENPFYSIMNEPNSTMQRLIRKLSLLDIVDEESGSGKLDLIIQLPYVIKSEARRNQAEARRKDIEMQLAGSKYGIAYTDGTEHITQLNRSLDNHLMDQVKYLTDQLFSQLGLTTEIMNGTAKDEVMLNYYSRTIEPIISALVDSMKRTFLTKTARSRGQDILYYRDPFKLVPVSKIAEIADKFTRNEIMSPNEIRQIVGMKPVKNEKADELRNRNLNAEENQEFANSGETEEDTSNQYPKEDFQNEQ